MVRTLQDLITSTADIACQIWIYYVHIYCFEVVLYGCMFWGHPVYGRSCTKHELWGITAEWRAVRSMWRCMYEITLSELYSFHCILLLFLYSILRNDVILFLLLLFEKMTNCCPSTWHFSFACKLQIYTNLFGRLEEWKFTVISSTFYAQNCICMVDFFSFLVSARLCCHCPVVSTNCRKSCS